MQNRPWRQTCSFLHDVDHGHFKEKISCDVLGRPERQDELPSHGADHGGGNHGTAPEARQPVVPFSPDKKALRPQISSTLP